MDIVGRFVWKRAKWQKLFRYGGHFICSQYKIMRKIYFAEMFV